MKSKENQPTNCSPREPNLIVACSAMLSWYPWEACSFLKGNRGGVDLDDSRSVWGAAGGNGGKETVVGM